MQNMLKFLKITLSKKSAQFIGLSEIIFSTMPGIWKIVTLPLILFLHFIIVTSKIVILNPYSLKFPRFINVMIKDLLVLWYLQLLSEALQPVTSS